ncbi:hypothetical protein WJX72_001070 [[Myrmecia] bisecta]|uniref:Uncharacterized protein n=1 Tax=[Myrmecia] bisecta TaxID=41462 RepID=A0AAW1PZB5_9CHLO
MLADLAAQLSPEDDASGEAVDLEEAEAASVAALEGRAPASPEGAALQMMVQLHAELLQQQQQAASVGEAAASQALRAQQAQQQQQQTASVAAAVDGQVLKRASGCLPDHAREAQVDSARQAGVEAASGPRSGVQRSMESVHSSYAEAPRSGAEQVDAVRSVIAGRPVYTALTPNTLTRMTAKRVQLMSAGNSAGAQAAPAKPGRSSMPDSPGKHGWGGGSDEDQSLISLGSAAKFYQAGRPMQHAELRRSAMSPDPQVDPQRAQRAQQAQQGPDVHAGGFTFSVSRAGSMHGGPWQHPDHLDLQQVKGVLQGVGAKTPAAPTPSLTRAESRPPPDAETARVLFPSSPPSTAARPLPPTGGAVEDMSSPAPLLGPKPDANAVKRPSRPQSLFARLSLRRRK